MINKESILYKSENKYVMRFELIDLINVKQCLKFDS